MYRVEEDHHFFKIKNSCFKNKVEIVKILNALKRCFFNKRNRVLK